MNEPRVLLIDAGNSRLKWGVFSGGQLRTTGSIDNDKLHQTGFAALTARIPTSIERVLISNVAGPGWRRSCRASLVCIVVWMRILPAARNRHSDSYVAIVSHAGLVWIAG